MHTELTVSPEHVLKRRKVYGVGVNDAPYKIQVKVDGKYFTCPYYNAWSRMLTRVYNPKYHENKPTYKAVSICKEWLLFSNFRKWMETQDWEGKQLDKDLLGNGVYSPEGCIFLPQEINQLIMGGKVNGKCKQGVAWHIRDKAYRAKCHFKGRYHHLGQFSTEEEAYAAYAKFKKAALLQVASQQTDTRIQQGLVAYAKGVHNG